MDKYLIKKFIAIVVCLLGSIAIIGFAAVVSHNITEANEANNPARPDARPPSSNNGGGTTNEGNNTTNQPGRTGLPDFNMLILGLDDGGFLPDAIMVLMYNGETNDINILSVPRDTLVIMGDEEWAMFEEIGRANRPPSHGWVKINEMHSFASLTHGHRILSHYLGNQLGIEIDYYVTIGLEAFRHIVDTIGGVYMYIPAPGFFYNAVDGTINVNISAGWQTLDGHRAEQVVRYRGRLGDIGRVQTQQRFMQAFFEQALSNEAIMGNLVTYANIFVRQVRTNWGLTETLRYHTIVTDFGGDSIGFVTLPGYADLRYNPANRRYSYYFVDWDAARELVDELRTGN